MERTGMCVDRPERWRQLVNLQVEMVWQVKGGLTLGWGGIFGVTYYRVVECREVEGRGITEEGIMSWNIATFEHVRCCFRLNKRIWAWFNICSNLRPNAIFFNCRRFKTFTVYSAPLSAGENVPPPPLYSVYTLKRQRCGAHYTPTHDSTAVLIFFMGLYADSACQRSRLIYVLNRFSSSRLWLTYLDWVEHIYCDECMY